MTRLLRSCATVALVCATSFALPAAPATAGTGGGAFTGTLLMNPGVQFSLTGRPMAGTWYLRSSSNGWHPTAAPLALDVFGEYSGTCESWTAADGQGSADVDGSSHSMSGLAGQAAGFHLVLTAAGPHGGTVVIDAQLVEDPTNGSGCHTTGETSFLATGTINWA